MKSRLESHCMNSIRVGINLTHSAVVEWELMTRQIDFDQVHYSMFQSQDESEVKINGKGKVSLFIGVWDVERFG